MLPIIYAVFSALMVVIVLLAYRKVLLESAIPARERSKKFRLAVGFVFGWLIYLFLISLTGILKDLSMPPKFPLLVFLPLVIGFIIFYRRTSRSRVLKAIPRSWPIYFQSFRVVVEIMLLWTFYEGIIPQSATFEGLNFDVFMGISALFVAYFWARGSKHKTFLYIWNFLGMIMVLFVAYIIASSMYFPQVWGGSSPLVDMSFIEMPLLLLAGFLAPLAIFMHVVSLAQLRE